MNNNILEPLTGVTWNILHGTFSEQVLSSIDILISQKQADFICLQEAQIEEKINSFLSSGKFKNWKAVHFHAKTQGHELAMLWNTERLQLKKVPRLILLPALNGQSFFEYLFFHKKKHESNPACSYDCTIFS